MGLRDRNLGSNESGWSYLEKETEKAEMAERWSWDIQKSLPSDDVFAATL